MRFHMSITELVETPVRFLFICVYELKCVLLRLNMNTIKKHKFSIIWNSTEELYVILSLVECQKDAETERSSYYDIQVESNQATTFKERYFDAVALNSWEKKAFSEILDGLVEEKLEKYISLGENNMLSDGGSIGWYVHGINFVRDMMSRLEFFSPGTLSLVETDGDEVVYGQTEEKSESVKIDSTAIRKEIREYLKQNLELNLSKVGRTLEVRVRLEGKTITQDRINLADTAFS